jgi:hypothetical protein
MRAVLVCALLLCRGALPQTTDSSGDTLLVARATAHIREAITALPNYTCTETIDRERQSPTSSLPHRIDLVRLEVAKTDGKELFAWPGARNFEDKPIAAFVGGGLIGDGTYGLFAEDLFVNGVASMKPHGPEQLQGRNAFRVDYVVRPVKNSVFKIQNALGSAAVGYSGSYWVDPDTLDLIRLDIFADSIPFRLQLSKVRMSVEYGTLKAGNRNVAMPRSSVIEFVYRSGEVSRDDIEFARCREFTGQTNIVFDGEDAATPASINETHSPAGATFLLPGNLRIPLQLQTSIDSATASVGDAITAVVEDDVKDDRRVWMPKGTIVHGRIRRIEQRRKEGAHAKPADAYTLVGMEFSTADVGRDTAEFVAELQSIRMSEGPVLEMNHTEKEVTSQWVGHFLITRYRESFDRVIPGVGYLYVTSEPFQVPAGTPMVWKTEALSETGK